MDLVTILLSILLVLVSPVGLVADRVAEGLIRDRIHSADVLTVRIDNAPNFQLVSGRVEHVRLAGRGIYPIPELRIDTLDVETDPIDLDFPALRSGELVLDQPFQAATHLILKEVDVNALLRSQRVQALLDDLRFNLSGNRVREANRYRLANPQVEFLAGSRLRVTVDIEDQVQEAQVETLLESGFSVKDGHRLILSDPTMVIDDQPVPQQLINAFLDGLGPQLTLKRFDEMSVIARFLQFDLQPEAFEIAVFIRVNPDSPLLDYP